MEFDLHTHTIQGSACSRMHVLDLVQAAIERDLAGICITDHDFCWYPEELVKLTKESGIQVYGGVELSTPLGEVLVYGVNHPLVHLRDDPIKLREFVSSQGGVMVAAHPFRQDFAPSSVLTLDERERESLLPEAIIERRVFEFVDTLEVYNGRSSQREIQFAQQVADLMGKAGTGGSDAHSTIGVGSCTTVFHRPVYSETDLLKQLRSGSFSARKNKLKDTPWSK